MKVENLARPAVKANPFPFFTRAREESPVLRIRMGRQDAWLVTRYEDVERLLRDHRFVKDRNHAISQTISRQRWMPRSFELSP